MNLSAVRRARLLAVLVGTVAGVFLRRAAYFAARPSRLVSWLRRKYAR